MTCRLREPDIACSSRQLARAGVILLAMLLSAPSALAEAVPADADAAQADRELLRGIIDDGIVTSDRGLVSEYLGEWRDRAGAWITDHLPRLPRMTWLSGRHASQLAAGLIVLLLVGIALVVIVRIVETMRRPRQTAEGLAANGVEPVTAEVFRARIEALLGRGALREALAVVWSYLTHTLAQQEVGRDDRSLTNREFVELVRRVRPTWPGHAGLTALALDVEHGLYGEAGIARDDLERLLDRAEELAAS